jgi:hypothetical protein
MIYVRFTNESLDGDCVRKVLSDSLTCARMILRITLESCRTDAGKD